MDSTPKEIEIPWLDRWGKDSTPPDPDFIARLEEMEHK